MPLRLTPRRGQSPQTADRIACTSGLSHEQHRQVVPISVCMDFPTTGVAWQEYTTSARAGAVAR
jgi:hypothetical protein